MILHPSESRLNEFADSELSRRLRIRTAAHLEGCSRCRNTIVAIRRLSREARLLPGPTPPAGLRDRILERLAAGERVILPVADPPRPAMPGRRLAAAVAATLVIAVAASIMTAPAAHSEASQLSWFPEFPEMGQELSIEFHSTSRFAGQDTLLLRGVLRTAEHGNTWHADLPAETIATLVRDEDDIFRTRYQFPEDVVYAVLSIEDVDGLQVVGQQYWAVLVHKDGIPTYVALMQKYHDLALSSNWEAQRETARRITRLYPDKPGGWAALSSLERQFYGPSQFALLKGSEYRREFARLEWLDGYADDDLADMYLYAIALDDSAAARRWGDRLVQEAPGHPTAKGIRVDEIVRQGAEGAPLAGLLDQLEDLWEEGGLERSLPETAFRIALQTHDIDAMGRWLDRFEQARPSIIDARATQFAVATLGREAGVQRIRSLIARLEDPSHVNRALYRTADQHRRDVELRRQALEGVLGQALIHRGAGPEGLDYLLRALERGWNAESFSQAARIRLSEADTSKAFELLARVAVDSWTDRSSVDSINTAGRNALGAEQWEAFSASARNHMTDYYVEGASPQRSIDTDIRVEDGFGVEHTIGELMADKTTIFAFWSRNDFFAREQIERIAEASRRVGGLDGKLIALVQEGPSSDWDAYAKSNDLRFSVYHDVSSTPMVQELEVWGYQYFVVDGSGTVRFSYSSLDQALNQVAALHYLEERKTVTSLVSEDGDRLP